MPDIILEYQGDREIGMPFIAGVPARDLVADDLIPLGTEIEDLVGSGLYVEVSGPAADAEPDTELEVDDDAK